MKWPDGKQRSEFSFRTWLFNLFLLRTKDVDSETLLDPTTGVVDEKASNQFVNIAFKVRYLSVLECELKMGEEFEQAVWRVYSHRA